LRLADNGIVGRDGMIPIVESIAVNATHISIITSNR
jgi:hypothetical protein